MRHVLRLQELTAESRPAEDMEEANSYISLAACGLVPSYASTFLC